jgi:hypothetical protein
MSASQPNTIEKFALWSNVGCQQKYLQMLWAVVGGAASVLKLDMSLVVYPWDAMQKSVARLIADMGPTAVPTNSASNSADL